MTGAEIREARARLGLTQVQLADALGVSPNTLARWERGEIPPVHPTMLRLALERLAQKNA